MSTKRAIFWMRVKRVAKHHKARAVQMLLDIGATLQQAVRFVALAQTA